MPGITDLLAHAPRGPCDAARFAAGPVRLKLVDPDYAIEQMEKWTKLYEEIVVKPGSGT